MTLNRKRGASPSAIRGSGPTKVPRVSYPSERRVASTGSPASLPAPQCVQGEPGFILPASSSIKAIDTPTLATKSNKDTARLIGENSPTDDSMEYTESQSSSAPRESVEISDEEQDAMSYASDYHCPTDRSFVSPSPTDLESRSTSNDRKSPYVSISSREHSLYLARRRRSEEDLAELLSAADALRNLSSLDKRSLNGPASQVAPIFSQTPQLLVARNKQTTPATSKGVPRNAGETSDILATPRLACLGTAPRVIPNLSIDPHDGTTYSHGCDDPTAFVTSPGTHPIPPIRHVRFRGIFLVGSSAPVKIDQGIEVYLKAGVDGRVDFII